MAAFSSLKMKAVSDSYQPMKSDQYGALLLQHWLTVSHAALRKTVRVVITIAMAYVKSNWQQLQQQRTTRFCFMWLCASHKALLVCL